MINTLTNSLDYNYTILECELKKALYPLYQEKLCDNFLEKISNKLENFCLTANYTNTGICNCSFHDQPIHPNYVHH